MNYKHLHYFMQVAEAGCVARASERLRLSPQTISGQVHVLEDELGSPLFVKAAALRDRSGPGRATEFRGDDEYFAISIERRITHPCVSAITCSARGALFAGALPASPRQRAGVS
jgi:hypothetical protein